MSIKNYYKKVIGERIKDIRLNKGMTLEEFGKLFNASKSIVYRWENGTSFPNPERLKAIAKIGDTTVEELLYLNQVEFNKRMENKDDELRELIFEKLVSFFNELKRTELNNVVLESEKINRIVSLIIKPGTKDKDEKLEEFANVLVDNLMSKTYILYWNLVYELCFSEDNIQREAYVSGMLFNFLKEYLQTDERYTLPLILFTLEETKKDIKSITDNISNDSRQPINKVDLLERIDDLIAFVSNNNK
nr:MAG TPA: helix-turn-helix domain protein [Caudoviricetes sp.]